MRGVAVPTSTRRADIALIPCGFNPSRPGTGQHGSLARARYPIPLHHRRTCPDPLLVHGPVRSGAHLGGRHLAEVVARRREGRAAQGSARGGEHGGAGGGGGLSGARLGARAVFTPAGVAALRELARDRRAMGLQPYGHVLEELDLISSDRDAACKSAQAR